MTCAGSAVPAELPAVAAPMMAAIRPNAPTMVPAASGSHLGPVCLRGCLVGTPGYGGGCWP
ncbi:hypothetical protein [Microlunatus ginsengisoli]|uniref:hypothetical protein n=1 Tax=Microlunatus ginsengisoli TaxID=363863 RepID=UPI0031DD5E8D